MTSPTWVTADLHRIDGAYGSPSPERAQSRWRALILGATTPDRLARITALLVLACLVTAALSLLVGSERAKMADERGSRLATLNTDASLLHRALQEAHTLAAGSVVTDDAGKAVPRARYYDYIRQATTHLGDAASLLPDKRVHEAVDIMRWLPRHVNLVETARSLHDNNPALARRYSERAATLMQNKILEPATALRDRQYTALKDNYQGLGTWPIAVLLVGGATVLGLGYTALRERRRTNRAFSLGVLIAGVTLTSALVWWIVAAIAADIRVTAALPDKAVDIVGKATDNISVLQANADLTSLTMHLQQAAAPMNGIAAGPAILALIAACGAGIGIGRRVREYR